MSIEITAKSVHPSGYCSVYHLERGNERVIISAPQPHRRNPELRPISILYGNADGCRVQAAVYKLDDSYLVSRINHAELQHVKSALEILGEAENKFANSYSHSTIHLGDIVKVIYDKLHNAP